MTSTTYHHLLLRLSMSGAISSFPLYAFMVCIGTTLPFYLYHVHYKHYFLIFSPFTIIILSKMSMTKYENSSWFQTFTMFCMLYVFFWVIPWRLNFMCRHFGTLCLFHLHRLWRWNRQSVPKHRHIKFRCQGITQKKTYNTKTVSSQNKTSEQMNTFCAYS